MRDLIARYVVYSGEHIAFSDGVEAVSFTQTAELFDFRQPTTCHCEEAKPTRQTTALHGTLVPFTQEPPDYRILLARTQCLRIATPP